MLHSMAYGYQCHFSFLIDLVEGVQIKWLKSMEKKCFNSGVQSARINVAVSRNLMLALEK